MQKTYLSFSVKKTINIAKNLARQFKGGEVIYLYGNLGVGKTTFIQGLAKGLGITRNIPSPTFIIVRQYPISRNHSMLNRSFFYHIDLYRIENDNEIRSLKLSELCNRKNILAIEWAQKLRKRLPAKTFDIYLSDYKHAPSKRKIKIISS